ncbi:MAG: hypothetical protein IJ068_03740 [Bacilli bacterium]|nr:hypothetical protein [Bacilli bacterium]
MRSKLDKIRKKYLEFNIYELNTIVVIISFIIFLISIYYVTNIYLIILMYVFILYFARNYEKNIIKFISTILPIVIFGYVLIHFVKFDFYSNETFKIFRIIIKILMSLDCICILYYYFKARKVKLLKLLRKKYKKYTFKELRKNNIDKFRNNYHNYLDSYLDKRKIRLDSDYFKVIESNIDDKVSENLNEFVVTNYLRFYKNQRYNKKVGFNVFNLLFLIFNVIILILVLIVR